MLDTPPISMTLSGLRGMSPWSVRRAAFSILPAQPVAEGGDRLPLGDQKGVGGDAQRGMVVEAAPSPPFIVADPYFLFQIQIIALDAPAEFGRIGERCKVRI